MMRSTRRQRRGGAVENSPNFLEAEQIPIELKRAPEILHIKDDVAEVMGLHVMLSFITRLESARR
jgi:hypothetical protein